MSIKRLLLLAIVSLSFISSNSQNSMSGVNLRKLEIYYLTASEECPSVREIAYYTKQVVDSLYSSEIKSGTIVEKTINILETENQNFCDKWQIYTNGLMFLAYDITGARKIDMNDFAFSHVPSDINEFKRGIEKEINMFLYQR